MLSKIILSENFLQTLEAALICLFEGFSSHRTLLTSQNYFLNFFDRPLNCAFRRCRRAIPAGEVLYAQEPARPAIP